MSEIWKDLPGFKGHYKVSNLGRVKTVKKKWSTCKHPDGILSPEVTRLGYLRLNLYKENKRTRMLVHRCVMSAFDKLEPGKEVNHKDGDKSNNRLSNLECVTRSQQIKHAYNVGLLKIKRGEQHHSSKYSDAQAIKIKQLSKTDMTRKQIAKATNTTVDFVKRVRAGQTRSHLICE